MIRAVIYLFKLLVILSVTFNSQKLDAQNIFPVFLFTEIPSAKIHEMTDAFQEEKIENEESLYKKLNSLKEEIKLLGHIAVSIDSLRIFNDTAYIFIYTGSRITEYIPVFSDEDQKVTIASGYHKRNYRYFEEAENQLQQITDYLNSTGYPFARTSIIDIKAIQDTLFLEVEIFKGDYYVWDTLDIGGDLAISNVVLQKILRIREGMPYNNRLLQGINEQLSDKRFLSHDGNYTIILTEENKARVKLSLEKESASGFQGIIGFGTDTENPEKFIFSGDMTLNLVNSFAQAEEVFIKWLGIAGDQKLNIRYLHPYLPLLPFGLVYDFDLYKKGDLYYTLNQKPGVIIPTSPKSRITTYWQHSISKVLDRSIFKNALTLPPWSDYTSTFFGLEYNLDRTDQLINPSRGIRFFADIAGGQKRLTQAADIPEELFEDIELIQRQARASIAVVPFLPLTQRLILRPAISSSWLYNKTYLENDLFFLGGINNLRGFDENSITASAFLLGSFEIRYRFEERAYLKMFLDAAWYEKKLKSTYTRDIPYGFGLGAAIPTPAGILQIDYAYGIQRGNPLDFRAGRLHFGLKTQF